MLSFIAVIIFQAGLTISPRSHSIQIWIKDSGEGMSEDVISKIFDPFFTIKPTGIGTGLGLSVVYGIVKNHKGDIHVESTSGKGSTFVITIPAKEPAKLEPQGTFN